MSESSQPATARPQSVAALDDYLGYGPFDQRHRPPAASALTHLTTRFDWYAQMRADRPVAFDPENNAWGSSGTPTCDVR